MPTWASDIQSVKRVRGVVTPASDEDAFHVYTLAMTRLRVEGINALQSSFYLQTEVSQWTLSVEAV